MPIVSKETIQNYEAEIKELESQLSELEPMVPNLQLAQMLRDEMVSLMGPDGAPQLSAEQIGELAYKNVLQKMVDKARDDLAARYESDHRKELYDRVIKEVEEAEGPTIMQEVKTKIESDPKLAVELRDSARKELGARAYGVVSDQITVEQQAIVDEEAERQLNLDRLDVQFALDKELDLSSDEVTKTIKVGDKLVLYSKDDKDKRNPVILTWTKDAHGKEGWVITSLSDDTVDKNSRGYWETMKKPETFVKVGVVNKDLEKGSPVVQEDKLVIGLPLVIIPSTGKPITPNVAKKNYYGNVESTSPLLIDSTDFQTKSLVFHQDKKNK